MNRGVVAGLRGRLLWVALALLIIPWAGVSYMRSTADLLRQQQERQLRATATAIAAALHDRPRLAVLREESQDGEAARAEVRLLITGIARSGLRIWILDNRLQLVATAGDIAAADEQASAEATFGFIERHLRSALAPLLARWLEPPGLPREESIPDDVLFAGSAAERALDGAASLSRRPGPGGSAPVLWVTHPVWLGETVAGIAIVEESTDSVVSFRHRAMLRLIAVTLIAFTVAALVLLLFATRISTRLRRLSREAEQAIDSRGRVMKLVSGEHAHDEIGDLSRSFSTALKRLADYNSYLENLARRLNHELRTPIAVVRSSLDNLRMKALPADSGVYIERAEDGLRRLDLVLTRMAEATQLEQTVAVAERERYDAAAVVRGCVAGYESAYPQTTFALAAPDTPVMLSGSPDLLAQMLDKLVSNAVDFAAPGSTVSIRFTLHAANAELVVVNQGPPLPEGIQLFESLQSQRERSSGLHLGLGLYIARLVTGFHRGRIRADNLPDGSGVAISVELPTLIAD